MSNVTLIITKVRIWDTVNKEHILKNEFQPLSGHIKDLQWSSDNQRIIVGGEGREKVNILFFRATWSCWQFITCS